MPQTLLDKIWDAHEVAPGLLYIDLHLVHEVTSPQAFDGLRLAGRTVRRPDRTLATADHNVPTDGTTRAEAIIDELSRVQVQTLERNCARVRRPALLDGLGAPGDRPRDRAGAGRDPAGNDDRLRRLAHGDARRVRRAGLRHRHERGGARPRDAVPRAAPPARDAHPLRGRGRFRRHRKGPDPRDDRPDGRRRRRRPCRRVRGAGDLGALDGGADDALQHDDRGRRPGGHGRSRRGHLRVVRAHRAPGSGSGDALAATIEGWRELRSDEGAQFDTEVLVDASAISPQVTWGTNPGMVVGVSGRVPSPDDFDDARRPRRGRARAGVHGARARHARSRRSASTASSSARAPTRASATCARRRR